MMNWIKESLALCVFGFLKEFRPSGPFVVDYLTGPLKNLTEVQVYREIYPVGTYCYLATLLPVLLLTDFLRYKPIIVICGISGICTYIVLLFSQTVRHLKIFQFFYGLFLSTEIGYSVFMFAKVDKQHYLAVSSYIRVAILLGRFTSGVTSQLTLSFHQLNYRELNYITFFGLVLATIWAVGMPSLGQSNRLNQNQESNSNGQKSSTKIKIATITSGQNSAGPQEKNTESKSHKKRNNLADRIKILHLLLWRDFLMAYSDFYVLKWSVWWTLATCGYMQVVHYIQFLWKDSILGTDRLLNGTIEAGATVLGVLAVLAFGKLGLNWSTIGETILSIFALIQGCLLLMAAQTHSIWFSYIAYIGFDGIYQAMITVASAEIAKNLSEYSYGLIFGTNTLVALILQSILTICIIGSEGFALSIRSQYIVCGGYFVALGTLFMILAIYNIAKHCRSKKEFQLWNSSLVSP